MADYHNQAFVSEPSIPQTSSLDDQNICLAWRNLRVQVNNFSLNPRNQKPKKTILRNSCGSLTWHGLTGILGPSGAGKTTLLDCLTGQRRSGLSGEIYLDTQHPVRIAFIEQHIHQTIIANLTVGETLSYAFRFKNSDSSDRNKMWQHIHETTKKLMLDSKVLRRPFKLCSGGEQKRVAVAQELMALRKPNFLFLDEPTTGLDSTAAYLLMQCLKSLTTDFRMSVTLSIHQPSDPIMQFFTQIYVLARGGETIYAGPPDQLQSTLEDQIDLNMSNNKPPIEEFLKIACEGVNSSQVQKLLSNQNCENLPLPANLELQPYGILTPLQPFRFGHFLTQFQRSLHVTFIAEKRLFFFICALTTLWYFLLSAITSKNMLISDGCVPKFSNESDCSMEDLIDLGQELAYVFYLAIAVLFLGVLSICHGALYFAPILRVLRHEHRNGWYSSGVFFFAFTIVFLIETSIYSLLSTISIYFSTNHHAIDQFEINWARLGQMALFHWCYTFYLQSTGQLFGALCMDYIEMGMVMGQVFFVAIFSSSGLLLPVESMGNQMLIYYAKFWALPFISKGLIYVVYGFERCDPLTEYSKVLENNFVNPSTVFTDLLYVLLNSLVFRLATFGIIYLRFSYRKKFLLQATSSEISSTTQSDFNQNSISMQTLPFEMEDEKEELNLKKSSFLNQKILVAWRNLSLFSSLSIIYKTSSNGYQILNNLDGHVCLGTLTALLGSSGAGKTSLLRVLSGQCRGQLGESSQLYLSTFQPISTCYVTQEISGHLWPGLSVAESIFYASKLKNGGTVEKVDHTIVTKRLVEELGLDDVKDTKVEKCSGGERKRLAVALELTSLQMPNLVCLDEPTSGLDSNSAELLISSLRALSRSHNIALVVSVHQPNHDILHLFDQIYCLARGGLCIYHGPPDQIAEHISKVSKEIQPEVISNFPIEQLVTLSCQDSQNQTVVQLAKLSKEIKLEQVSLEETQLSETGIPLNMVRFQLSFVLNLTHRYLCHLRGYFWPFWLAYFSFYLIYAGIMRYLFDSKIAQPTSCISLDGNVAEQICAGVDDVLLSTRYAFVVVLCFLFVSVLQGAITLAREIIYFRNETRNGWYTSGAFYLAKSLHEILPMVLLVPLFVAIIDIYSAVRPGIYLHLVLIFFLTSVSCQALGHSFALLTRGRFIPLVLLTAAYFFLTISLVNGLAGVETRHAFLRFLEHFSTIKYAHEAIMILHYSFDRCGSGETSFLFPLARIEHPDHYYYHSCLALLIFHIVLYRLVAFALLVRLANSTRSSSTSDTEAKSKSSDLEFNQLTPEFILPGLKSSDQFFRVRQIAG